MYHDFARFFSFLILSSSLPLSLALFVFEIAIRDYERPRALSPGQQSSSKFMRLTDDVIVYNTRLRSYRYFFYFSFIFYYYYYYSFKPIISTIFSSMSEKGVRVGGEDERGRNFYFIDLRSQYSVYFVQRTYYSQTSRLR